MILDISDPIFYQLNGFEIIYTFNVDDAKCGNLIVYPYCTKSKVFVGEWILVSFFFIRVLIFQ